MCLHLKMSIIYNSVLESICALNFLFSQVNDFIPIHYR